MIEYSIATTGNEQRKIGAAGFSKTDQQRILRYQINGKKRFSHDR